MSFENKQFVEKNQNGVQESNEALMKINSERELKDDRIIENEKLSKTEKERKKTITIRE